MRRLAASSVRPSVRPPATAAVKSPPNFKPAPTATTALTPQRRRQIVVSRDPISRHHVTGNRGNRFNLQRQTEERRRRQWVVMHGVGGWRNRQVRERPTELVRPPFNLSAAKQTFNQEAFLRASVLHFKY